MTSLLLLLCGLAAADPHEYPHVVEDVAGGRIDWTLLRLEVTARSDRTVGAWKDRLVQEQDAVDSLSPRVEALAEQVALTPDRSAGDLMDGDPELGRRLAASVGDWKVEETRYRSGGGVEMDAVLDLQRWLRPALASLATPGPADAVGEQTGLVIDARGLPFRPSLAPTVVSADGTPLVRAQLLADETIGQHSPVLYVSDPADPRAAQRAGAAPVFVQATSIRRGALVLAVASAVASPEELAALVAAGRVVIVADAP